MHRSNTNLAAARFRLLTPGIPFLACEQSIASGIKVTWTEAGIFILQPFTTHNDEKRQYSSPYTVPLWTSSSSKMATSSVVNFDSRTVLCLHSCRRTGLRHVCMLYRYANYNKSNAESLHRSSKLEKALNVEAGRTRTSIMFDMNG